MAEDSGAFKTIPVYPRRNPAFRPDPESAVATKHHRRGNMLPQPGGRFIPSICNQRPEAGALLLKSA
jgi:hypothetical protein